MKKQWHFRQLVLACMAAAVTVAAVPTVQAQKATRADFVDAFYELRKQTKNAYKKEFIEPVIILGEGGQRQQFNALNNEARKGYERFSGVDINNQEANGKIKLQLKVWAVPVVNGTESDQKVNLDKYKWRSGEKFHLYFETAVPLGNVQIFQDFPNKPSVMRFPDPQFRESYNAIPTGKPYQYPVRIVLDNSQDDELMTMIFDAAGAPNVPALLPNAGKLAEQDFIVFSDKLKNRSLPPLLSFFGPDRDITNGNPDNVAGFYYGVEKSGRLQLRIQKR